MTRTTISVKVSDKLNFDKFRNLCNENVRKKARIPRAAFQGLSVADFFSVIIAVAMSHKDEVHDCCKFENATEDVD